MELTDKHIENLRAILEIPNGLLRSEMPHPRHVQMLAKHDFVEVCGEDWIAHVTIKDKGRCALDELDQTYD